MSDTDMEGLTVRWRARPGLLLFPRVGAIPTIACRTDKMEIAVNGAFSFDTCDQLGDTLYTLSNDNPHRPGEARVLNALGGRGRDVLRIRRKAWLFGGRLVLGPSEGRSRIATLYLSLNPTRFAEHCRRAFSPRSIDDLRDISRAELLRSRREIVAEIGRDTLDGRDNLIGRSAWISEVSRRWAELVTVYASEACRLVEDDFNAHSAWQNPFAPAVLRFQSPADTAPSIGYVEKHVEFQVDDDVHAAFHVFEQGIWNAGTDLRLTEHHANERVSGRTGSARWIETWLRQGVKLKVYVKAADRLRVEVEYHGASAGGERSVGQLVHEDCWTGRRSFAEKIGGLQADAVRRIAILTNHVSAPPIAATAHPVAVMMDLMIEVRRLRFPIDVTRAFLAELFAQGHVGGIEGAPVRRCAEALVRKNLFEPVSIVERNSYRRYRPVPVLQLAIETLRSLDATNPPT